MRNFTLLALPLLIACAKSGRDLPSSDVDGGVEGGEGTFGDTTGVVETCEDAVKARSNVGCEYWPTVTANSVWSIFDFAVLVSNPSSKPANVSITGPSSFTTSRTVGPNAMAKIYLPWVAGLKGPDTDSCGTVPTMESSAFVEGGAFHLVSDVPVIAYQFNALEYAPKGGPENKDWSTCPGSTVKCGNDYVKCLSYTNDAALLLPTSGLTQNYLVTGIHRSPWQSLLTVTATRAGKVRIMVPTSFQGTILLSSKTGPLGAGSMATVDMAAGDVLELLTARGATGDLSGVRVAADMPVMVLSGALGITLPRENAAADNLMQVVLPLESWGKRYLVTPATLPTGLGARSLIKLHAGLDGVKLTYAPTRPEGCPEELAATASAECSAVVDAPFEVAGDQPFAVSTYQLGSELVDPVFLRGDPSQSLVAPVEQLRRSYRFLAPDDYSVSYADIVFPTAATSVLLDGASIRERGEVFGSGEFKLARVKLEGSEHLLTADRPVGLQVNGYGVATSYQYPGGLEAKILKTIPN